MQVDLIRQLEELVNAFGINVMCLSSQTNPDTEYDQGLRRFLQYPDDILRQIGNMEQWYEEKILYIVRDSFEEHYMSFLIPEEYRKGTEKEFLLIGPYIMEEPEYIVEKMIQRNQLSLCLINELKEYYYSVPLLMISDAIEGVVLTQMGYIFHDREGLQIRRMEDAYRIRMESKNMNLGEEHGLSMAAIEERYLYEEMMMAAVRTGDMEKVIEVDKKFQHYRLKPRSQDTLRDVKNLMIVWNTLFRKAVQQADVHPAYIDRVSENFAKNIENCIHINELASVSRDMMHTYCLLVRNHSLQGHSPMVRDALNYIDFHIREPLSLKLISEQVNVSSSYLSAQFKKETGKTLTDYINEKRIHESLVLLAATELPIQEVAERVGIYDENYYARLFKKYQNQTAKQYRNMMKLAK